MTDYIAEFKAPKQRATRQFGYVITQPREGTKGYAVQRKYYDEQGGYDGGTYDLTYEAAAAIFADKVNHHVMSYGPGTFDNGEDNKKDTLTIVSLSDGTKQLRIWE